MLLDPDVFCTHRLAYQIFEHFYRGGHPHIELCQYLGAALLLRKLWVLSNPKILFPLVQTVRCRFDIKLG